MIRAAGRSVIKLHRRLLPANPEIGWTPYLWLVYLSFFFWRWIDQIPSNTHLVLVAIGIVAFLVLYFDGFWHQGPRVLVNMAGIVVIGLLLTPLNPGAVTFFIYAAGFAGFLGSPRRGWLAVGGIAAAVLLATLIFGLSWFWAAIGTVFCLIIGAVNIYFAEVARKNAALRHSQEEIERLASLAERERIARDLHDLLGHTLTAITVKAELARKLSERSDPRAGKEIADVERISRDALKQVRAAVAGFADIGLRGELKRAQLISKARGIDLDIDLAETSLEPRRETALAMVLREAMTNVIRHSLASRCQIKLERTSSAVILSVEDDGRGAGEKKSGEFSGGRKVGGSGLDSMRQRLLTLGGWLEVEPKLSESGGFRVTARLPANAAYEEKSSRDLGVDAVPEPA